jgi:hypothetical protein
MYIENINASNVSFIDEKNKIEATIIKQGTLKECENESNKFRNIPILKKNVPSKNEIMSFLRERFISKNMSDKENLSMNSSGSCSNKSLSDQNNSKNHLSDKNDHDPNQIKISVKQENSSRSETQAGRNSDDVYNPQSQQKITSNPELIPDDSTIEKLKESKHLNQEPNDSKDKNEQASGQARIAPNDQQVNPKKRGMTNSESNQCKVYFSYFFQILYISVKSS